AVATNLAENGVPVADLNPADNTATATTPLLAAPDLVLTKTDGGVTVTADEGVVYTLTIANTGSQGATGVKLTERVPANSRFAALVNDPGWACSGLSAGSVCTLNLGSLAAGAAPRTATFAVRVDSPLAAGVTEIVNDAFIDDDGSGGPDLNPADNRATEATPIDGGVGGTGPDLVVTKSDGGIVAGAGDMVLYAVTVANVGDQHASGVELSETVPANASFVAAASAPGWSCSGTAAGSACTLAVGSVAAGAAPQSFAFAVRIDDPLA
ncbi:MAG: DUF11 domain-containing protein, partial [Colwellia sp.]|nr:DUF11 domain-containing protein [Colwellia sp.]